MGALILTSRRDFPEEPALTKEAEAATHIALENFRVSAAYDDFLANLLAILAQRIAPCQVAVLAESSDVGVDSHVLNEGSDENGKNGNGLHCF